MRSIIVIAFVFFLSFAIKPAFAWNDVGHLTVARIAYSQLSDDEREAVVSMLRHHPHLSELLLKDQPANIAQSEWIFVRAATWPDNIRPPHGTTREPVGAHSIYRFHHPTWHYANFAYRAGQVTSALPNRPISHFPQPSNPADRTDILEQLEHSYLIVRGKEVERSEPELEHSPTEIRAIRLCWLMHLMGDIHQPLHVATLVDDRIGQLQHGDDGGNKLAVRLGQNAAPRKLHAVWDDLLGTHGKYDKVVHLAEMLSHDPSLARSQLQEFADHKLTWEFAAESYQIAKDVVYQNGHLPTTLWSEIESHELTAAATPVMSPQLLKQSQSIAERRIVLAGYRLAERLKFIVSRDTNAQFTSRGNGLPVRNLRPSRSNWPSAR